MKYARYICEIVGEQQDEQHQYVPPGSDEVLKPLLYQENSRMSSCAEITRINMDKGYTVA